MPLVGAPLPHPIDLTRLLEPGLSAGPDEIALQSAERHWTWRELDRDSDRIAAHLIARGLQPGDRVASLMPNRNELLVHYLACLKARLVITPLNYRYMAPEIDHALRTTEASILLSHAERDADLAKSEAVGKLPLGTIRYGAPDDRGPTLEQLLAEAPPEVALSQPQPNDPAFIFFTSGSTGRPKGATHSRHTFGAAIASIALSHEMTPADTILPGSSISHVGGIMYSLTTLAIGARVVTARTFDAHEVLPLLCEHRPTVMTMLPAALITMVRDHDAKAEDFSSVRLCISGGDKVSAELQKEFAELTGFQIDENWGMSEVGIGTINPPSGVNKLGSIGVLAPGYEGSIRDDDGNELPAGEPGRLWIRAPSNMIGYWARPDATAETIVDGWLDTGDVMHVDEDGYLRFDGRKKQIIVHDGSNISPQDVEEAVLAHEAVASAGVVGVHDLVHGENVWAYITLKEDVPRPTPQDVIRCARERVGYKAPEVIIIVDDSLGRGVGPGPIADHVGRPPRRLTGVGVFRSDRDGRGSLRPIRWLGGRTSA